MSTIAAMEAKYLALEREAANFKAQWKLKSSEAAACYKVLQRMRADEAKADAG